MPIHDWKSAPSGYFHHFHQYWSVAVCTALNDGRLPDGVFAMVEQHSNEFVPDVLALETHSEPERDWHGGGGGTGLATEPPKAHHVSRAAEELVYAAKANRIVLHDGDRTLAVIKIVSPGNKRSAYALRQFVQKSMDLLHRGIHLLVIDLFPPTPRDPQGIHPAIWEQINDEPFELPIGKPLTLASYVASPTMTAYVEPVATGDVLPEMPVFLDDRAYVRVPLEETYESAWKQSPKEFRERIIGGVQ